MSQKITNIIQQQIPRSDPKSPLYPSTQSVLNFAILTTKKANQQLLDMKVKVNDFSGNPKIIILDNKMVLNYPEHIDNLESISEQNEKLEAYVLELLSKDNIAIKLETENIGGIFKWLNKDEQLLLVTLYRYDASRSKHRNLPNTPFTIKCYQSERQIAPVYPKLMAKLLYYTFIKLKKNKREQFDTAYKKFLDNAFRPFEEFLYNERLSIRDPKYRPKCKYLMKKLDDLNQLDDRAYLEIQDPPRQITEAGNSVVPIANGKKRFVSARIADYDEFNSLLIFEDSYKLKDWPEEGTLLLEGDMASNRRKTNAIRQIKSRGLSAHARLADIIIRPWGLPGVNTVSRSYFNEGISHDNPQSKPQAESVDISLCTNDITLIHGPPGTGKTTVIVEIIRHVISNGGRVMMCAPTHVAVDNVLERTTNIKGISAIRVGGTAYMNDELQKFQLKERSKSLHNALPSFNKADKKDQALHDIQGIFVKELEKKGKQYLENLAINQANLVCGTTIGIARYEPPLDNPVDFDYLIIDEASKATVMEFLVPAVRAKKWILVGDHRQLPPYVNEQEIRIYVQRYFESQEKNGNGDRTDDEEDDEDTYDIYDDKTNRLIASLRRYHEELHALGEGQTKAHWNRIIDLFDHRKKPIKSIEEMINFALGSCFHYFLTRLDKSRNARLIVQHRMPTLLADFIDEAIYKGNLKTSSSAAEHGLLLPNIPSLKLSKLNKPLLFISTEKIKDNFETPGKYKGYYNSCEAEVIAEIISVFSQIDAKSLGYTQSNPMTIGVITYYAGQSREINRHLRSVEELEKTRGWKYKVKNQPIRVRVSIVDRFQGQEQDIVLLSLTRSNKINNIGFLKNLQRVNVSLSRAKQNLLIIGNSRFFAHIRTKPVPILRKLAIYTKKNKLIRFAEMEDY